MNFQFSGTVSDVLALGFFSNAGEVDPEVVSSSATRMVLTNPDRPGAQTILSGFGLVYDGEGTPIAGTVNALEFSLDDVPQAAFFNMEWPIAQFTAALDDLALDGDSTRLDALIAANPPLEMDASRATGDITFDLSGVDVAATVTDGAGNDRLSTGAANDSLTSGDGQDTLVGGAGNDTLDGSGGRTETQGLGDVLRPGLGADTVIGHAGQFGTGFGSNLDYDNIAGTGGLTITVGANGSGTAVGEGVQDSFSHIINFSGSADGDVITGSSGDVAEIFEPLGGDDTVDGGTGAHNIGQYILEGEYAGSGAETGTGLQMRVLDAITFSLRDSFGDTDRLTNFDAIRATNSPDLLDARGYGREVTLRGHAADDTLYGTDHGDVLQGDGENDELHPGDNIDLSGDLILPGTGMDTVYLDEVLTGGAAVSHEDIDELGAVFVQVDAARNTGSIGKGGNGITTLISPNTAMEADGLTIAGTSAPDVMNVSSSGWLSLFPGGGSDEITILTPENNGIVRLDYRFNAQSGIFANLNNVDADLRNEPASFIRDGHGDTGSGNMDFLDLRPGARLEIRGTDQADVFVGTNSVLERFIPDGGDDQIDGGAGYDVLRYDRSGIGAMTIDLARGAAAGTAEGVAFLDRFSGIEEFRGSRIGDRMLGGEENDHLRGMAGDDYLEGRDGQDTLDGGDGDDTLAGLNTEDLRLGGAADVFLGGAGRDWVSYEGSAGSLRVDLLFPAINTFAAAGDSYDSIENLIGSRGADNLRGTFEANHMIGGRNVDYIFGRRGDDTLEGGIGDDVLFGGVGRDTLMGGENRDRAQYSEALERVHADLTFTSRNLGEAAFDIYDSIEDLAGSAFNDVLGGDAGDNGLYGREGNDSLYGRDGDDYLNGGANFDRLDGGLGNDTLRGGIGADMFVFNGGADVVEDYTSAQADRVAIDDFFITAATGLTGAEVFDRFGSVIGGDTVLDFGAAGSLTLQGVTALDADSAIFVF